MVVATAFVAVPKILSGACIFIVAFYTTEWYEMAVRVFKDLEFASWADDEGLADESLCAAAAEIENGLVNGNLTYLPEASNLTLSFAATNILNKAAANSKYTNPYEENSANYTHETGLQFVPPRQFIGTVGYSF